MDPILARQRGIRNQNEKRVPSCIRRDGAANYHVAEGRAVHIGVHGRGPEEPRAVEGVIVFHGGTHMLEWRDK